MLSATAFAANKPTSVKGVKDKSSYAIGYQFGQSLTRMGAEIQLESFSKGMGDALSGKAGAMTEEEIIKTVAEFEQGLRVKMEAKKRSEGESNVKEGKTFLEANAKKPGVKVLPSGLQYQVITEGKGKSPKATDVVRTHYRGTLLNGKEFDSSYGRKEPAEFPVNGVIKGWTEALQLMKEGSKWKLFIPSELAYGAQGAGADIGPNSTLIFEVELLSVKGTDSSKAPR
ncbi:MAG: FKBP-type peptidyl-prolyl cis-trans isomerase [Betaproteobacteria bacterium]|nr:FKBP-type peptidyl-prolyl cis-trans isomerase [Betaproteobacteria bacterium]